MVQIRPGTEDDVKKHRNIFSTLKLCILQIENVLNVLGFYRNYFVDSNENQKLA